MPLADHHQSTQHHRPTPTRTHPQSKPPSTGILSFVLKAVIMCILTSLFFLCITLASILLIHIFLSKRHLRRRHRRRSHSRRNANAFSREELLQLDEFEYCRGDLDEESDCVICLERFGNGQRCRILGGCGHVFHLNCIDKWLGKVAVCPICRATVRLNADEAASGGDQSKREKTS